MKKLLALFALMVLLCGSAQALDKTIYLGGQMTSKPKDSESDKIGGGFVLRGGIPIEKHGILWAKWDGFKTGEGENIDNVFLGFSLFTDHLIDKLNLGVFGTAEGGLSMIEGSSTTGANVETLGIYSDLKPTTRLWIGYSLFNKNDLNVQGGQIGISWTP